MYDDGEEDEDDILDMGEDESRNWRTQLS
jgi:hypothetical protein